MRIDDLLSKDIVALGLSDEKKAIAVGYVLQQVKLTVTSRNVALSLVGMLGSTGMLMAIAETLGESASWLTWMKWATVLFSVIGISFAVFVQYASWKMKNDLAVIMPVLREREPVLALAIRASGKAMWHAWW